MDPYMKVFHTLQDSVQIGPHNQTELSGNVLPLIFFIIFFFQGLQPGKTGPLSHPGARSHSVGMEIHVIHWSNTYITSLMSGEAPHGIIDSHCDQPQGARPTFHRSLSLMITARLTLAAAACVNKDTYFELEQNSATLICVAISSAPGLLRLAEGLDKTCHRHCKPSCRVWTGVSV